MPACNLASRFVFAAVAFLAAASLLPAGSLQAQPPLLEHESYADRAERALIAGDLTLAANLYEDWLQADPGDYVSWYNYACVMAQRDELSKSLAALQNAVTMGWRDSTWAANDPDLSVLHENALFASVLTQMGRATRSEQTSRIDNVRYAEQLRLAPYQVHLPFSYERDPDRRYPLVVLLHDRGADMSAMNELREKLALPGIVYVQPRAPHPVDGGGGFEYWPRSLANDVNDSLVNRSARSMAGSWVRQVVTDIVRDTRVDTTQIFVVGYSQGGAAAYLAALEGPGMFRGVGLLSGFLPESHRDSTALKQLSAEDTRVFIGHGRRDRVVQSSEASVARDLLTAAGATVAFHAYPIEHEISDEMVVDLADWILSTAAAPIQKRLPEAQAPADSMKAAPGEVPDANE